LLLPGALSSSSGLAVKVRPITSTTSLFATSAFVGAARERANMPLPAVLSTNVVSAFNLVTRTTCAIFFGDLLKKRPFYLLAKSPRNDGDASNQLLLILACLDGLLA
jgi:hypothetical protein